MFLLTMFTLQTHLGFFDTVFRGHTDINSSIASKVVFSLSGRHKISPVIGYGLKFVKMYFLSKIDITMTTINKKL